MQVRNAQRQSLSSWAKAKQGNCWLTVSIITLFIHTLNQPYVDVPNIRNDCVRWLRIHQELFTHGGCEDSPSERPLIKKAHEQMLIEPPELFPFFHLFMFSTDFN